MPRHATSCHTTHTSPFDTDQERQRRDGQLRFPWLSSVLYFSAAGGPTIVLPQRAAEPSPWKAALLQWLPWGARGIGAIELHPAEPDEVDLVSPRRNDYCLFQARAVRTLTLTLTLTATTTASFRRVLCGFLSRGRHAPRLRPC